MTLLRRSALALVHHTGFVLSRGHAEWAQAMLYELDHIEGDGAAFYWALGCAFAGYSDRVRSILFMHQPQFLASYALQKRGDMQSQQVNRISSIAILVLSITALLPVAIPFMQILLGHPLVHERDEGASAHIFQLSVGLFGLSLLLFLATSDWHQPKKYLLRRIAFPVTALALAFAGVYFMHL